MLSGNRSTSKSQVLSMRLQEQQLERLRRLSRKLGYTASEAGALLVEESLRRIEFAYIDFRDSPCGRQAYIQGSSLAVWEVIMIARQYKLDVPKTAKHLLWESFRVQAALNYAAAFPEEVESALQDNLGFDQQRLSRILPQTETLVANSATSQSSSKKKTPANLKRSSQKGNR